MQSGEFLNGWDSISFIAYFFLCMYIQVQFDPSPSSLLPSSPIPPHTVHITAHPHQFFTRFISFFYWICSFHSIPLPICACQAFSSFRLTRLYLYPVPSCGRQAVYIRKKYVYKLDPNGYSVLFLQQYSWAPASSNTTPNTWPIGSAYALSYWLLGKTNKKAGLEIKSNSILRHTPVTTHPCAPTSKTQFI